MNLHELKNPEGARSKPKRVGRGPGSGWGKTCGKGQKGQKARSGGKVARGFEGGQIPMHRRLPKFGFTNIFRTEYNLINLEQLASLKEAGQEVINRELLVEKGFIRRKTWPVKLLGRGDIDFAIKIEVDKCSESAKEKITQAGGEVIEING